ncbi:MAG TPA: DUF2946 family protein [Aquabacterium sp.]|jgi:hypothetical protein|uniref:DUF2946 family protein n=1 Tax=Aquabacterium sp. TaxID=1872578 RepID=UPI002E351F13|nr:DUF2946 family protein [Aquabacterium sp.]HEX5373532.1 DUF2946 family protein [Aquabacterium sp.]
MRRFLAVLLLVLLPLQSIWAAAAPYCQHEASGSSHVGHHTHEHHQAAADDVGADTSSDALTMDHADCHACQAASLAMLGLVDSYRRPVSSEIHFDTTQAGTTAPPSIRPERPQWRSLA